MEEYLTINPGNMIKIRKYEDINSALDESIKLNESDIDHPTFYLYKAQNTNFIYMGRLMRNFGTNNFYWEINDYQTNIKG